MLFAFKHMDRSPALEDAAKQSIGQVFEKFGQNPTSCNVTFSTNSKFHSIHLSAHLSDGHSIELEQGEDDMYKSVDLIADKLTRDLKRHKDKMIGRRHQPKPSLVEEVDADDDEV